MAIDKTRGARKRATGRHRRNQGSRSSKSNPAGLASAFGDRPGPDSFARSIEQALELCLDPESLERHSPLVAPYFLGGAMHSRHMAPGDRGRKLVELLRSACDQLDTEARAILNAAYFQRDTRLQHSGIALALHLSDRTYFRHKAEAIHALATVLVTSILPPLRTAAPENVTLWGRTAEFAAITEQLRRGGAVYISGVGGVGKTSLASAIVRDWPQAHTRVFWHTIHIGLNDQLGNVLFSLAYFLRANGALATWRQIVADKGASAIERVTGALRFDLTQLRDNGVDIVLCLDEVDLLRPELDSHAPILDFLSDLRGKVALLMIGQRQAVDSDLRVALGGLSDDECAEWMRAVAPDVTRLEQRRLIGLARGSPAQLKLLLVLRSVSQGTGDETKLLAGAPSLELLLGRIWRRIDAPAQLLAQQLAVLRGPCPADALIAHKNELDLLVHHGLAQHDGRGVQITPFARELLARQIPRAIAAGLHARAAEIRMALGEYAEAARHWLEAGQPEQAVWLLFARRAVELERGNGQNMLALLNAIDAAELSDTRDRDALLALRAQLGQLFGDSLRAETDARAVGRRRAELLAYASEALGEALTKQGRADQALEAYRNGLSALLASPQYRAVRLRNKMAFLLEARLHRVGEARQEALSARLEAEIMAGSVEDRAGNYAAARAHYEAALALAETTDGHLVERALLFASYGNLLWKLRELDPARRWLREALRLDQQRGDVQAEASQRINLSAVEIMSARYDDALAEARAGLTIAESLGQPYLVAGLCSNAGEACCGLKRFDEALSYAQRSLGQEEDGWRPYALTVAGLAETGLGEIGRARQSLNAAVTASADVDDAYAEAAAWRALGDTERLDRSYGEARVAYAHALRLYERLGLDAERGDVQNALQRLPAG